MDEVACGMWGRAADCWCQRDGSVASALTDAILCSAHAVTGSTSSWPPSGTLRTAWAALVDVERTAAATLTRQAIRQVTNLHKTMWMWHARPSPLSLDVAVAL